MVDLLSIGAGATQLYRSALTTVSNNIANMNTDGYTRQVPLANKIHPCYRVADTLAVVPILET